MKKQNYLKSPFKEQRFIYWEWPGSGSGNSESPGLLSGSGRLFEGAGRAFDSLSRLIDVATRGISRGVDLVDFSIAKIEKGITFLVDKIEDPGKPTDLAEYEKMPDVFDKEPSLVGIPKLDNALRLQVRLFFLKYKARQYAEFLKPSIDQLKVLESTRNAIAERAIRNRKRIKELDDLIRRRETTIKEGTLPRTSPRRIELETELAGYRSEKEQLERDSSFVVMWPKPQYQKTEFPPGSGEYVDRLIFSKTEKVKIDLNILYRWAEVYTSFYKTKLEEYEKEMERLAYHRERLLKIAFEEHQKNPQGNWEDAKKKFESEVKFYQGKGETAEETIRNSFVLQGGPTDVLQLAGAIKNPNSFAPTPGTIRTRPNFNPEDVLNSLP